MDVRCGLPTRSSANQPTGHQIICDLESTYNLAAESKLAGDEFLKWEVQQLLEDQCYDLGLENINLFFSCAAECGE